ncbi:MAG: prolipoprotein diacylglyceryl transferase [Oscillospiraceae bacterium]|nr:prolipoprotein diacylglyceryl transferase [Oscillospiraceae bacterium]
MIPSVEIFGKIITPYFFTALTGIFVAGFFGCKISAKRGIDSVDMLIFMLVTCIGVFFGGILLFGLTTIVNHFNRLPEVFARAESAADYFALAVAIFGGSVFYGGLLGGIAAGLIFIKAKKLDLGAYSDVMALVAPFFHVFGRMGCFLSGCCYGIEWEHGFTYHHSLVEEANGVPRFPVQLLESLFVLSIFAVLLFLFKSNRFKNRLFYIYLIIYSAGRFFLEFLRGDQIRGIYYGVSTSQLISVLVFAVSVFMFVKTSAKKRKNPKN